MKALSIRQPWAAAIAHGDKRIENRTRNTLYRGPVLIHASQTGDTPALAHPRIRPLLLNARKAGQDLEHLLALGAVVATARLVGCHPDDGRCTSWSVPGQWHWVLDDVHALPEPIPCKGALGLWTPPPQVVDKAWPDDPLPDLTTLLGADPGWCGGMDVDDFVAMQRRKADTEETDRG